MAATTAVQRGGGGGLGLLLLCLALPLCCCGYSAEEQEQEVVLSRIAQSAPQMELERKQDGVNASYMFGSEDKRTKIILFDTRYHRDPLFSDGSILRESQWLWFEKELNGPPSDLLLLHLPFSQFSTLHAQQAFIANKQFECSENDPSTLGYVCNGPRSCTSYLTFRSQPPYNTPVTIAYLLNSNAEEIARINEVSDLEKIPLGSQVVVPVNCSCSGKLYQHNATYTLKYDEETYYLLSNDTLQGLTTCQAMMKQNVYDFENLYVGLKLLVPLRCACPSKNQSESGVKFLLTYITLWDDDVSVIAERLHIEENSIYAANEISESSTIYPFNSLLVPLSREPTRELLGSLPPVSSPPLPEFVPTDNVVETKRKNWVVVGIGIGAACFLLLAASGVLICFFLRRKRSETPVSIRRSKKSEGSTDYTGLPSNKSDSASVGGIREVLDSITIYKFDKLQKATSYFSEDNRTNGNVYRGVVNGNNAAIKRMRGDVTNEVKVLKTINHSSVIRLSGFCLHEGCTYLIYEFAEKGSLSDWLHDKKKYESSACLSWKQRVQIAYDVADGLNYLHNYANPPYIHKDLKSSNILLDGNFGAKVANFGLARAVASEEGDFQLTRHVIGTQGYMAPEYLEHGLVTPKLDVYAYGVVLLELLLGREAQSSIGDGKKGDMLLSDLIKLILVGENVRRKLKEFVDPRFQSDYPLDMAFNLAQLALACVNPDVGHRPTMSEVFLSVSKIHSSMDWESSEEPSSNSVVYSR